MKFIVTTLALCTLLFSGFTVQAEEINAENQTVYLVHFGRGIDSNAVNLRDFYTFINDELLPISVTGVTIMESQGVRFDANNTILRENTTVVEIVGDPTVIGQPINDVVNLYCDKFSGQNVSAFVVEIPNVSTTFID